MPEGDGLGRISFPMEYEKNGKMLTLSEEIGKYSLMYDAEKFLLIDSGAPAEKEFTEEFAKGKIGRRYRDATEPYLAHIVELLEKYAI